jgi:predicted nuclease with RNAse H fold
MYSRLRGRAVGVDVSLRRGLDVVLLDGARLVDVRSRVEPGELTTLLEDWEPEAVGIDAPSQWGVTGRSRQAERDLSRLGIRCYATPSDIAARSNPFYAWMHVGIAAHDAAVAAGYRRFDAVDGRGTTIEVFPHATAIALRGELPPPGWRATAAGKRSWRLEALDRAGVKDERLRTQDQVDAALAAVTACLAVAGEVDVLGQPDEDGLIVMPTLPSPWLR